MNKDVSTESQSLGITDSPLVKSPEVRIRPDILQAALLDDIAIGIKDLLSFVRSTVPQGNLIPMTVSLSGPDVTREDISPPWFSMVIINDGPDQAEFTVNSIGNRFSVLAVNEIMPVDMKQAVIGTLWLRSISGGAASVRIYGVI